jgi:hypothetical protein
MERLRGPRALEDARRLLPSATVLKVAVERVMLANGNGGGFIVIDEQGVVCRYARVPRSLSGTRRAWLVTSVARRRR